MRKASAFIFVLLAGLVLSGETQLFGSSFHVAPVRIELSDQKPATTLQIGNEGDDLVTVQVRVVGWQQQGADDRYPETDEIFLSPPIAKVAPHGSQTIRIALRRREPLTVERTYRVIIEEVPAPAKQDFMGIHTLLRVSVPIYRKPSIRAAAVKLQWTADFTDDGALRLTASNAGEIHSLISAVSVAAGGADPVSQKSAQCILAGGKREWVFHNDHLKNVALVSVEAETESGKFHDEIIPRGK